MILQSTEVIKTGMGSCYIQVNYIKETCNEQIPTKGYIHPYSGDIEDHVSWMDETQVDFVMAKFNTLHQHGLLKVQRAGL